MKIKFKDNWELDCIVLRKNGEKITFKYDELTDKLVKIIEVKEEELKELLDFDSDAKTSSFNSSNISSDCEPFRVVKPKVSHIKTKNKPKEMTPEDIEKIKQIKQLWLNKDMTGKQIAERVGVKMSIAYFWKYNTPKELIM